MIDQRTIDEVLNRADIEEVVGARCELKKKGSHLFACCPFHSEDTPSFAVYTQSGRYHCYGCQAHGNAISFVMHTESVTFPEAVTRLAKRYGVDIREEKLTPEKEIEHRKKEAMLAANERLLKVYQEEFAKSKEAQSYAYRRWGRDYCNLIGIGYCPPFAKLVDKASISDGIVAELKLKSEKGFDKYCNRIVIPIRDRFQRIIGFTARTLDKDCKAKYLNSDESLIYHKGETLFGIDVAWQPAKKSGTVYVVEGAPDCMRLQSIGVLNTVAPLGTALTDDKKDDDKHKENQIRLLKKMCSHLCFLPDADPPKAGEEFGRGIIAVMENGEKAMKAGFSVTVKQIEVGEEKKDPDEYCKTMTDFRCIEEQDYVLWLAKLLFKEGMTTVQTGDVINRLAALMSYMGDETTISMCIAELTKYAGKVTTWKKAIDTQRKVIAQREAQDKEKKESDMYRMFGFNVEKNKKGKEIYYYSISENGGIYEWSNFVMRPLFHIKDTLNAKRIYLIRNVFGAEELIELKQEDLVSIQKFKVRIESLGNFVWKATQKELDKLKQFLYEKTETAKEVTQLGWQRQGFYAFGNGVLYKDNWLPVDDYGIVRLEGNGNYYLPATSKIYRHEEEKFAFERKFIHLGLSKITLSEFTEQMFTVFGDNARIGFMFVLAALFRDIVVTKTRSFPILNIFGQKGSGKTELGVTLMSFFVIENIPKLIHNTTPPALNDTVSKVANALVHIDEYKNDLPIIKTEFLKGLWDGTGRTRMNMDLDKKSETTKVSCGVILTGQEMPTADIALFSRLIYLTFATDDFTSEQEEQYNKLMSMRQQGMTHLTIELLKLRDKVENTFDSCYEQTKEDVKERLKDQKVMDRIMYNWVKPLAMLRCLSPYISTSLSYSDMLNKVINGILAQNAQCKLNNELAEFWNMVQYLASEGEILEGGDYRIEITDSLKTDIAENEWLKPRKVLLLQKSRIFQLYKRFGKAVGDSLLPEGSLKHYLENSSEYLGEKAGVRFKVYHKGIIQYQSDGGMKKEATTVQRTYCFDYDKLEENFKINLMKTTESPTPSSTSDDENNVPF